MRMLHNGTVTGVRRVCYFLLLCAVAAQAQRFVILGDRTGSAQPGVYEQVWRETAAARPEFVVSVGDTIEGLVDSAAEAQWQQWRRLMKPYARIPLYLTPGNHDIWSAASGLLFEKYAGHPRHYSFDRGAAHFTVLDNSGSDALSDGEMAFLESDLKAHAAAPLKFIVSHRPSWLMNVALRNPDFALHRLARKYGVRYVIAGHVHQMLRFELDGITYVSMPSAGGHLRLTGAYRDGWFFAYTVVQASDGAAKFEIHELKAPHGEGRVTTLEDWGMLGLKAK
jgi:predicted phosphodiesterase